MRTIQLFLILTFLVTGGISSAQQRTPVMEHASLLNSVGVSPEGWLEFGRANDALTSVFLPQGSKVTAILTKQGSDTPIHTHQFSIQHVTEVFARVDAKGAGREFKFSNAGNYSLTFKTGNHVMAAVDFNVYSKTNDDQFDPKSVWYCDGPWSQWAYAYSKLSDKGNANLQFRMWAKRESFNAGTESDIYDVDLVKEGDVVAEGRGGYISTQRWRNLHFNMRLPESKGGRALTAEQFVAQDGIYSFVVKKNDKLHAVYQMVVKDGRPMMHARQSENYEPRYNYLCPRYAAITDGTDNAGNTVWMNRLDSAAAKLAANGKPAAVKGAGEDVKKRWEGLPKTIDAHRPFNVVVTNVETRTDTHIAAGEDIIAFGTGHPTGVKYLVAGEKQAREIPDGESYRSTIFHVCGKKIVLVRKNQVCVFDTETGKTSEIPTSQINLYNPVGGLHQGNLINADGMLVATVNKATEITDGNIIKVIDVSGDQPVVIPIKNANYNDRQVSSVALDARNGLVAVSSAEKKLISVAQVAPLANQNVFDMADYRGVNRRQIYIEGTSVTYADSDLKIRVLTAGSKVPKAITEKGFNTGVNGFIVRKGRLVVTTNEHVGSRYQMVVGDIPQKPAIVNGTGTPIEGTSGKLGFGGCAAITVDKTVFIAGTPSGGIGVGEHLQMLDNNSGRWIPITNEKGNVISAIDVTNSYCLLAFKSADRQGRTTIGYATHGAHIKLQDQLVTANESNNNRNSGTHPTTANIQLADDNPYNTHDEIALAKIQSYLETEKNVGEAYVQAFGEKEGAKKTVDTVLKAMKQNGHQDLIEQYKRLSIYVADQERPAAMNSGKSQADADPKAIDSVLNGQWKAIRFSAQGNDLPDDAIEGLQLTFAKGKYVMTMPNGVQTGVYKINTKAMPMQMDIFIGDGKYKGEKRMGSFKLLKDNRLLMVFGTNQSKRPSAFVPDSSGETIMVVYEKRE